MKHIMISLLLTIAMAATGTEFPWLGFDKHDLFEIGAIGSGNTNNNDTLRTYNDGLRVTCKSSQIILTQRKFRVYTYNAPRSAIFDYTLHSAAPVKFRLNCTADQKPLNTEEVTLQAGRNMLRLSLPDAKQLQFTSLELSGDNIIDLTFHKAKLDFDSDAAHSFTVKLDRPDSINFFYPDEAIALQLVNHAKIPLPYVLEGKLSSFSGESIEFSFKGTAEGNATITLPLRPKLPLLGYWDLHWTINSANNTRTLGKTGLAVLPSLPQYRYKKGDFMFGICSHPSRWPVADRELEALLAKRLGASFVRTTVTWNVIQPKLDPEYFDYSLFDSVVDIFGKEGLEIQGMLVFTARYAAPENVRNSNDARAWIHSKPNLNAWQKYAESTVERYRGKIHIWEIWNEPDLNALFGVTDYLELAKVSSETIRRIAPENTIFSAGFAGLSPHPNRKDPDFQYKAMRDGKQYFDVHAYHGHADFVPFVQQIDHKLLPLRKKAEVTVPWYANETAVCAINGSERTQAITLFKKLLFCWSREAIGYNWYDLRNDGLNLQNPENTYGLVTFEYEAKPAAAVYHTLVHYFREARYLKELNLPPESHAYLFRNGQDLLLTVWSESNEFIGPVPVNLTGASKIERLDCMGNGVQLNPDGGNFLLTPTVAPAIYKISKAQELEAFEPLFTITSTPAMKGKTFQITLTAVNPYQHKIELQFHFISANGITFQQDNKKITLEPAQSQNLYFEASATTDAQTDKVMLDYNVSNPAHRETVSVPLRTATVIQTGNSQEQRKPDFRLNKTEQVVSIGEGDPAMQNYTWTGTDDLSAQIWLQAEQEFLEIYVISHDDIFVQKEAIDALWKADSLQMALLVPGQEGAWEIDLARHKNDLDKYIRKHPLGFEATTAKDIILTTHRDENRKLTVYRAKLPFKAFGLSQEILKKGIRFNILLNDNDGPTRETYMQLYPGVSEWKNINFFPMVVFE